MSFKNQKRSSMISYLNPLNYFKSNDSYNNIPDKFEGLSDYIQKNFQSIQSSACQKKIKEILLKEDLSKSHEFLKSLIEWGVREGVEQPLLDWIHGLFDLKELCKILVADAIKTEKYEKKCQPSTKENEVVNSAFGEAKRRERCYFKNLPSLITQKKAHYITSIALKIFSYPFNLLSIFTDVISFSEASKHYTTLWEKYLIVQVFTQTALLIYYFSQFLLNSILPQFIITAGSIGLMAIVAFGVISTPLFIYYRWFRSPDDIPNCINCERDWLINEPLVEREEGTKILEALTNGKMVALTADSGEGKTSLLQDIVRRAREEKGEAEGFKFFEVKVSSMVSKNNLSFEGALDHIINTALKNKITLIIDDIQTIFKRSGGPDLIRDLFNKPGLKLIAVAPTGNWKEIKQVILQDEKFDSETTLEDNPGGFFKQNVKDISLTEAKETFLKELIWSVYNSTGSLVPIDSEAVDEIIRIARKTKTKGTPNNVKALIDELLTKYGASFKSDFISKELSDLKEKNEEASTPKEILEVEQKIKEAEETLTQQKKAIEKIHALSKRFFETRLRYVKEAQLNDKASLKQKSWKLLTNFFVFESFQNLIRKECQVDLLKNKNIDLMIDKNSLKSYDTSRSSHYQNGHY
jgi:ATP-dependent Clp protease ATP-binding subunit ClpB